MTERLTRPDAPSLGLLNQAVREFKEKPPTPELANRFWQTFLETSIKSQGLDIPVPRISCDRTSEELKALKKEGRMWVPETKLTYPQLGEIFPQMRSYYVSESSSIKETMLVTPFVLGFVNWLRIWSAASWNSGCLSK